MKRNVHSILMLIALVTLSFASYAQTTYTKVTSASGLEAGAKYLIVGYEDDGTAYAMSYQKTNNRHAVTVSEAGDAISVTVATDASSQTEPFEFTLGGAAGAWTLYDELAAGYLYASSSSSNQLKTQGTNNANGEWQITFNADGTAEVISQGENERNNMRYNPNNGTPLFSCYASTSSVDKRVSFFKAGGTAEPDPEPSNYPTNFTAHADKVEVTLSWTDATGEQLPSKYLVVCSTGNITVPTDGVPVADSDMAKNVAYGAQSVVFGNMDGNTTYHFAIFPYTNSGANIDYKTSSGYPTTDAQTDDIYLLLNENFTNDLGVFTAYNVYGEQDWHFATYQGNGYAYMNGYANQAAHQNEDWLISPELNGNFATISLRFRTARNYDGDNLRLMVSSDYDGVSEPSDFEWEELTDLFDWSSSNYEWTPSGEYDIKGEVGARFYIAFVYTSDDTAAAAWEVDDVMVIANTPTNIAEHAVKSISVSPNPANDVVRFELSQQAQVSVIDLSGRKISEANMSAGASSMNVATLENGVYFLSVTYTDGSKEMARFIKF